MKTALTAGKKIVVRVFLSVIIAASVVVMTGCTKGDNDDGKVNVAVVDADVMPKQDITFTFGGDTRSTLADAQMTDLWVFDYVDGMQVGSTHQTSDGDGFGSVTVSATYGEHTFCFVASRGTDPTVDGTTITWAKSSDTFWQSITLDIEPGTSTTQAVTLERVTTRLRITVTDVVPAELSKLCITPATWYYGIDFTTGEPCVQRNQERSVTVPSSYVGTSGTLMMSIYGFSGIDEWTTDVVVTARNSSNASIGSVTLSDVPFLRNRVTSYSGGLFQTGRSMTVEVDDAWYDDYEATW